MLVLGRKENESILIGENIRVTIVGRAGSSIRVGVQAPKHVRIVREELAQTPARHHGGTDTDNEDPVVIASIGAISLPKQAAG